MKETFRYKGWMTGSAMIILAFALVLSVVSIALAQGKEGKSRLDPTNFDRPTYSSPIAMDATHNLIWVVNPDDDSVSVIGDLDGNPHVLNKYLVGDEPQSIAIDTNNTDPSEYRVYVANAADNGITIINVTNSSATSVTAVVEEPLIVTGAEPWNIVASPDGKRVFVANSAQDTITVLRTDTQAIVGNVDLRNSLCNVGDSDRHYQPRGLAVTLNSDRLYVTRFLSFTKAGGVQADDNGKEGVVCQLDIPADLATLPTVANVVTIASQDTGFTIDKNGDTIADPTAAYPNQLQSIVIRGNQAFLPNIASSPSGPLKFNVDTQSFVNVLDNVATGTPADASATKFLNLHLGAREPESGIKKLFFSNPWAIAFTNESGTGNAYVVSSGSDLLVKLNVASDGTLDFTVDDNTTRYIDLNDPDNTATNGGNAGKNPLGIVIRNIAPGNNRAYVLNYISRNVSIVDLDTDSVEDVVQTTALPIAGTQDEQLHVGKEVFFSSRGLFDNPGGATVSLEDRLSSEGWQNCASCHFAGLTDSNIWAFAAGPRKSVPLNGTWSPYNPNDQRLLNYSAIFDEVQDFELNIRNVSGPGNVGTPPALDPNHGLLIGDNGDVNAIPSAVNSFALPNAGRPQMTITLPGSNTGWPALDALKEWARFAIRTPNGALTTDELTNGGGNPDGGLNVQDVADGRELFFVAGCQTCHGGTKWSTSHKDFTSPPIGADIFTETGATNVVTTQFLARFLADVDSFNLGVAGGDNQLGDNVGSVEQNEKGLGGLGHDHNGDGQGNGFNIPSLLGIWALQPYYHNGACETLECVLSHEAHRIAGVPAGADDPLAAPADQAKVVEFLRSLDSETDFPTNLYIVAHDIFIDPPTVFAGEDVVVGVNVSLFGVRSDLINLANNLGLTELNVRFSLDPNDGPTTINVPLPLDAFAQDFGQTVITATWNVPASAESVIGTVTVSVDPDNEFPEDNESDNDATREVFLLPPPPDTTPPVVSSVRISDDDPFNDNDIITNQTDARVKFVATDDDSGLNSFCIVRYQYDNVQRRWLPLTCDFQPLPAPETGTTDTFIVDTTLPPRAGVAYAFVWVKDNDGNISTIPGFDVVSFVPDVAIDLNRNDVVILRILLAPGETLTFNVTPEFGDVDVSVFDNFTADANRIAVSANNGITPESVTVSDPGTGRVQIEINAVVNSRFAIEIIEVLMAEGMKPIEMILGSSDDASTTVGGPPASQAAIGIMQHVFLPAMQK